MKRITTILIASLLMAGCQVEYHPYDIRVTGQTGINARNIVRIEDACLNKREIRFAVISDTQRQYDETKEVVKILNQRDDIDFVLHTGDLSDFGMRAEFERQRDILNKLNVPYVVLLGNHDCLATGEEIFEKIFGDIDFSFTAGNVYFACLNTNALEFDINTAVPNFAFMEEQLSNYPTSAEKSVIAMHAKPYTEQFDNNVANLFQETIRRFPGLQFCVNGHDHNFVAEDLFNDGVIYYECENIGNRGYLLFTINDEGYAYEHIIF